MYLVYKMEKINNSSEWLINLWMGCCAHFPLWLTIERAEISSPQSRCESRPYLRHSSITEAKMYKVQFLTEFSAIFAMSGMVSFRSKSVFSSELEICKNTELYSDVWETRFLIINSILNDHEKCSFHPVICIHVIFMNQRLPYLYENTDSVPKTWLECFAVTSLGMSQ